MTCAKVILPGQTIGIIGGGQLGRMLAFSAQAMGYTVGILDPQIDCPAGQVASWQIMAEYSDQVALTEMAERCDVLTYEFENIDTEGLMAIKHQVFMPQGIDVLRITQNRQLEKEFLKEKGFPVAAFEIVGQRTELARAVEKIGYPSVLKTIRGGYDGHGQVVLRSEVDLEKASELVKVETCVLEEFVAFNKEASVMVSRNLAGDISVFPVAENLHHHNMLHQSIVPARISHTLQEEMEVLATKIAEDLKLCGVLGIEFFLGDHIYVNELAPRPHNSAHYSIDACDFSQFDLHVLSICQRPLPQVKLMQSAVMVNILGQHLAGVSQQLLRNSDWHVHLYNKKNAKRNRKMGHVTILSENLEWTLKEISQTDIWD